MSETPPHGLELLEWLKLVGVTAVTAIGSAWGWWSGTKRAIDASITRVESEASASLADLRDENHTHRTQIAVLETQQANSQQQLQSIHDDTKDIREKVDQLVLVVLNRK